MSSTTIVRCRDCGSALPDATDGWLRCPNCATVFCEHCAKAHHAAETGECDSTAACTACGSTCLVPF